MMVQIIFGVFVVSLAAFLAAIVLVLITAVCEVVGRFGFGSGIAGTASLALAAAMVARAIYAHRPNMRSTKHPVSRNREQRAERPSAASSIRLQTALKTGNENPASKDNRLVRVTIGRAPRRASNPPGRPLRGS